jgi:lipid-A-disaccharide synthase
MAGAEPSSADLPDHGTPISTAPLIGIVAGESSGDTLGAGLMRALTARLPGIRFVGVGGERMLEAGLEAVLPMDRLAVNGFREPILRLPDLVRALLELRARLLEERPAAFVGVDFNVFNLLLERRLKVRGMRTIHYVSPSVYAWRRGRVRRIGASAHTLLALYPFEAAFYRDSNVRVCYVGHPLADAIAPDAGSEAARRGARAMLGLPADRRVIALLPGSRGSEVGHMLPPFLEAAELLGRDEPTSFVIPCPRATLLDAIMAGVAAHPNLTIVVDQNDARRALTAADAALVKSGTSTLEAMLLRRPMVVSYRLGPIAYRVASALVRTPYVALPNILAGRSLVPELLQDAATPDALARSLTDELYKARHEPDYLAAFGELHALLRRDADARAAEAVIATMRVPHAAHDGRNGD